MVLILTLISVFTLVVIFPRVFYFCKKMAHMIILGLKLPGPPAHFIFGNAGQLPSRIEEWAPFFSARVSEQLKLGYHVMRIWLLHNLKIMPLTGRAAKDILDSMEHITKSDDYDFVEPWLRTGLLTSTGEKWRMRRKMLTPTFHFAMLNSYVDIMDSESKRLTEILEEEFVGTGREVDLFGYIKRCTLDIICRAIMGYELNSQEQHDHPYAIAVGEMTNAVMLYSLKPLLWFPPYWYLSGWDRKYREILKTLKDFSRMVIKKRKEILESGEESTIVGGRKAFIDMLFDMREENSLTDEDIREEVDTFMFEGHDTTSSGLSWTVWALATHQNIQDKVAKELFDIFGDSDREITVDDIKQMHYLDLVLKESLRMNPPVPFIARHLQSDLEIGGHLAPKESTVMISPLLIHRNEEIYPDPLRFDPDRFLPENCKLRDAHDYIPFSAGPRNCIGQKFAVYEEKVVITWLLRKFKISAKKEFHENICCAEAILRPSLGVPVILEKRIFKQ